MLEITDIVQDKESTFRLIIKIELWEPKYLFSDNKSTHNLIYEIELMCLNLEKIKHISAINFNSLEGYKFIKQQEGIDGVLDNLKQDWRLRIDLPEAAEKYIYPRKYRRLNDLAQLDLALDASVSIGGLDYWFRSVKLISYSGRKPEISELPIPTNGYVRLSYSDWLKYDAKLQTNIEEKLNPTVKKIINSRKKSYIDIWHEMLSAGYTDPISHLNVKLNESKYRTRKQLIKEYRDEEVLAGYNSDFASFKEENTLRHFLSDIGKLNNTLISKDFTEWDFIDSNTHKLENAEFGRRGEYALYQYLHAKYDGHNWRAGLDAQSKSMLFPCECSIHWSNSGGESFLPYDIIISGFKHDITIEVKSTRLTTNPIFYFSIAELQRAISKPDIYLIAIVTYLKDGSVAHGIKLNEEFGARFYVFTTDTISIIKEKIGEWQDYFQKNEIRFSMNHFIEIEYSCVGESYHPNLPCPNYEDYKYWKDFRIFVYHRYFRPLSELCKAFNGIIPDKIIKPYYNQANEIFNFLEQSLSEEEIIESRNNY